MACQCFIVPQDVLNRFAADPELSDELRRGFAYTAAVSEQVRQVRDQIGLLTLKLLQLPDPLFDCPTLACRACRACGPGLQRLYREPQHHAPRRPGGHPRQLHGRRLQTCVHRDRGRRQVLLGHLRSRLARRPPHDPRLLGSLLVQLQQRLLERVADGLRRR